MGLFDWLNEGMGSDMGGSSMGSGFSPTPPMPPMQQTGADMAPPLVPSPPPGQTAMGDQTGITPPQPMAQPPLPPGTDPMAAGGPMNNGPGLPPGVPAPPDMAMNMMRKDVAPITTPQPGPPTQLTPTDIGAAARMMPPQPTSSPQAQGIIGRALGLDPNREAQMRGSLGAGLKAAGENAHKPGLAAFAGSLGSGIEGGKGAADKTTDQQDRFLTRKLAANKSEQEALNSGDTRKLNQARTELALAQAKAAMSDSGKGAINTPEQLYLRAQSTAAQDGRLKALKTRADQAATQFGPDSPQAKQALKEHKDAYDETIAGHAKALGLDPDKISKVAKQPGMSQDNPVPKDGLTKEKFDKLPVGAFFVNPKDGRLLVKKAPAGANPQAAPQSSASPVPPVPVTAPAGSKADTADDED